MSAVLLTDYPVPVIAGMSWMLCFSERELKSVVRANRKNRFVLTKQVPGGYVVGSAPDLQAGWGYAGALILCRVGDAAIVCERLDDDAWWVAAVSNGAPLPGYDIITNQDEAISVVNEIRRFLPEKARLLGSIPEAEATFKEFVEDLLSKASDADHDILEDAFLGTRKEADARRRTTLMLGIGVFAALMIGLGGFFLFGRHAKEPPPQAPPPKPVVPSVPSPKPDEERARLEARFRSQVEQARKEFFSCADPLSQWQSWWDFLRTVPLDVGGWRANEVRCDADTETCMVLWVADRHALPSTMWRIPGESLKVPDTNRVQTAFKVASPPKREWEGGTLAEYGLWFTSLSKLYRGAGSLSLVEGQVSPPVRVDPPEGLDGAQSVQIGVRQSWFLQVSGPYEAEMFIGKIRRPGVCLKSAVFGAFGLVGSGSPTVRLEGEIVARAGGAGSA
jgi:hypothetical protein